MTYGQCSLFKICNCITGKGIGNDPNVSSIAAERLMRNTFSEIPLSKQ